MWNKKSKQQIIKISVGVFLGVLISPRLLSPAPVLSQMSSDYQNSDSWLVSEAFKPPSRGAPNEGVAGGSRDPFAPPTRGTPANGTAAGGSRDTQERVFLPLSPAGAMPFTVSDYPTFFWYIPPASPSGQSYSQHSATVEFKMLDLEAGEMVYKKELPVTSAGIMSHQLSPNDAPPLAEKKLYYWVVQLKYNSINEFEDGPFIAGWVERIAMSEELKAELNDATETDRPSIYAREGIWHEALSSLAQLRQDNPNDATILSRWSEFLQSVNLDELTEEPFIKPEAIAPAQTEPQTDSEMS